MNPLKVLIVGGYGTFGGRLAGLLAPDPRLELLISGRSAARAEAFLATLEPGAARRAVVLDRDDGLRDRLAELAPDIVVDATGPYQLYGQSPYHVVEACLALGISYVDLADGAAFVAGIARFDGEARRRGVFVLSGVSSFPVLTAAVVRRLAADLDRVDTVTAGLSPSPHAGIGLNVIRAIASYAGQPVTIRRDGVDATGYPLTETMRATVAPPGVAPLGDALFALVDVPDNRVLARHWPTLRSVWVGVAPRPESLFRGLVALSWLVRIGLLPSLSRLAVLLHWSCNAFGWGEDRGAMFVAVRGEQRGHAVERSWHMIALGRDGPLIPSMAVAAVIRRCLAGDRPPPGARDATGDVGLADYEALFDGRQITTGIRDSRMAAVPLYRGLLGSAWDSLPPAVRAMHDLAAERRAHGRAAVECGRGLLARLLRRMVGFPEAGGDVAVTVHFAVRDGVETWRRSFAGRSFSSTHEAGSGRWAGLLVERFGPFAFGLAVVTRPGGLGLLARRWSAFGVPLPLWLAPREVSAEWEEAGRFRFDVAIRHPLTGPIVRYRGWLVPE